MNSEQFYQTLSELRQLQRDILTHGIDAANLYLQDLDGDWLENWGEDEDITETLISFLESNDHVAVKVRQRLGEKSITAIAEELEKCRSLAQTDEQIVAVKKVLTEGVNEVNFQCDLTGRLSEPSSSYDDVELLDLAETLLEKLEEIFQKECL